MVRVAGIVDKVYIGAINQMPLLMMMHHPLMMAGIVLRLLVF